MLLKVSFYLFNNGTGVNIQSADRRQGLPQYTNNPRRFKMDPLLVRFMVKQKVKILLKDFDIFNNDIEVNIPPKQEWHWQAEDKNWDKNKANDIFTTQQKAYDPVFD